MTNQPEEKKEPIDENQMEESDQEADKRERIEDKIDRDLSDSFPASDAPGWTMGVKKRHPQSEKT